jgi:hypothetical protein
VNAKLIDKLKFQAVLAEDKRGDIKKEGRSFDLDAEGDDDPVTWKLNRIPAIKKHKPTDK